MARLWRIVVLLLAVVPLAVPAVSWPQGKPCKMRMAMDHACCPDGAKVAAPACCNARADQALPQSREAAGETRLLAGSQASFSISFVEHGNRNEWRALRPAYIPILLPSPVLRT